MPQCGTRSERSHVEDRRARKVRCIQREQGISAKIQLPRAACRFRARSPKRFLRADRRWRPARRESAHIARAKGARTTPSEPPARVRKWWATMRDPSPGRVRWFSLKLDPQTRRNPIRGRRCPRAIVGGLPSLYSTYSTRILLDPGRRQRALVRGLSLKRCGSTKKMRASPWGPDIRAIRDTSPRAASSDRSGSDPAIQIVARYPRGPGGLVPPRSKSPRFFAPYSAKKIARAQRRADLVASSNSTASARTSGSRGPWSVRCRPLLNPTMPRKS